IFFRRAALLSIFLLISGLILAQTGPANPQAVNAAATKPHDDTFIIGIDDVLAVNVWKEPDISRSVPVRSDGKISMPLVGELQAAGQTPHQLEQQIAAK